MEELSDYMIKFEKIKQLINSFKNDRCPKCSYSLSVDDIVSLKFDEHDITKRIYSSKHLYKCKGCNFTFYESQFYEVYFDEIEKIVRSL